MVKPEDASREELLAHIAELHRLLAVAQATIERQDARTRELERRLGLGGPHGMPGLKPHAVKRCRTHGGRARRGDAAPNPRHGRYSRFLPANLLATYRLNDPELIALRDHIALTNARIADLPADLRDREEDDPAVWSEVRRLTQDVRKLCDTERRRVVATQTSLTADQAMNPRRQPGRRRQRGRIRCTSDDWAVFQAADP